MLAALTLLLVAGGMNGSFAIPMKRVRGWEWEQTWLVWSFVAMVVIPVAVGAMTIPHLHSVYIEAGPQPLLRTAVCGMLWGASAVLFGLGITRLGVALGFGIILGTAASLGALIPLVKLHRERLFSSVGLLTILGVSIILPGVAACARAGVLREAILQRTSERSLATGLTICVLSGVGSSFMSVALNQAAPIYGAAENWGVSPSRALNAVWPILQGGGFVVNAAYCLFLLFRRGHATFFRQAAITNFGLVLTMAVLWSGSNFVYGAGARGLGSLGLVLGWPIFMAAIVLTANAWGILTAEWRGAGRRSGTWAAAGSVLLVAGILVIASAGNGM